MWTEDIATTAVPGPQATREPASFDTVALMNVLDRCPRPLSLLHAAHYLLKPRGRLLVASPLPFLPGFHDGSAWRMPLEDLMEPTRPAALEGQAGGYPKGFGWEADLAQLWEDILPRYGFEAEAFGRLPYISVGDHRSRNGTVLDNVLMVARKVDG